MKILQVIVQKTTVFIFTENPEEDINEFCDVYNYNGNERSEDIKSNIDFPLGYEVPILTEYSFLGKSHKCISLWFDNEDVPDFFTKF